MPPPKPPVRLYRQSRRAREFPLQRLRFTGKANNVQAQLFASGEIGMIWNNDRIAIVASLCVFGGCFVAGQESKPAATEKKNSLLARRFAQVAISPDGKRVAWVEIRDDAQGAPTGKKDIFIVDVSGAGKPVRLTAGTGAVHFDEGDVAWSSDSKRIAFLSDAAKAGQFELYVSDAGAAPAKKLTSVKGFLASPAWSPDGKSIAVLFTENATRAAGPLVAETPETGEIKDSFFEQRLALVDPATGKLRQVSPADTYIYEYDWAPDSRTIAVIAAKGNGDNNWYIAELFSLDTASGRMKSIYKPRLQIARPAVSPDGNSMAFIEGIMSDEGSVGGDVFLLPLRGGTPRNLTPERKASASMLSWSSNGKLMVVENIQSDSGITEIDPASEQSETLYRAAELLTLGGEGPSISLSSDGSAA